MALGIEHTISSYHYTWLIMVIYIFGIGYFGHKQRGIFNEQEFQNEQVDTERMKVGNGQQNGKSQYLKTGLSNDEAEYIQQSLDNIMHNEKPYLGYNLTEAELAGMIDTTSHKLSQVINERYGLNFFEYINKHRVKDVKKLLKSPSKADEKIMALAYDCGFNSKSAFYNFFKKETSLTPSEYRSKNISTVED